MTNNINSQELDSLKKYIRATNYLSVAQIYLRKNVLLKEPLKHEDIKPRLLGHWGTCPGINFVYAHINRLIIKNHANFLYVVGPGHGFPAIQSNLFVEGSLTHYYPEKIPYSKEGIKEICERFSFPYGYPSHSNPEAPGAILEGGELGYSLSVSYGAILDNPDLIVCCLVGDGEAETGPLAASWHANKIVSPKENGAILPIIHLNGYKISGPTILGRMSDEEIQKLFEGYGYEPHFVEYSDKYDVYEKMAITMDYAYLKIRNIQERARNGDHFERHQWPMIILRTPKGWTGVKRDGEILLEGNCKSHQVILTDVDKNPKHLKMLEEWLKSYDFNSLIEENNGKFSFVKEIQSLIPENGKSCGTQKYSYGGMNVIDLKFPDINDLSVKTIDSVRGKTKESSMKKAGDFLEKLFELNIKNNNLRIFSPDETYSNVIDAVFKQTKRCWQLPIEDFDTDMAREGKVMEMLSEHTLFGLMHGYTVTGRHGIFVSYEAFVQVIASMADQYAKFIKASKNVHFRKPLPAMNIILTSLLERQDHNGFSHQNPSFISSMLEKDGDIIGAYFPPDANCMICTMKEIFENRNSLNFVVAGKKQNFNWLTLNEAKVQMDKGIMIWDFASDDDPQVVLTASGDYVTTECMAAIKLIKEFLPKVRIRFVNVSELTALGVGDETVKSDDDLLDKYFTKDKGVVYNFHGYPQTIKKLLFDYKGAHRIKVNGYIEEGSTTTPFDMETRNKISRYHLVLDMTEKLFNQGDIKASELEKVQNEISIRLQKHHDYIIENGFDPEEINNWSWS